MSKKRPPPKQQQVPPAIQVFSKNRDANTPNPYHLDGDMDMYSEEKLTMREQLSKDPDIKKQINVIIKMYELQDGRIVEQEYKRMQRKMAIALRPDIEEEELEFVVDEDWKLDQTDGSVLPEVMAEKIFEMVDVWTLGVDKMQYITFIKLLGKKLGRKKVQKKEQSRI